MRHPRLIRLIVRRTGRFVAKAWGLLKGDFSGIFGNEVDEGMASRIRAEQLAPILRYSIPLAVANIFNIAVAVAALGGKASPLALAAWGTIMLASFLRVYIKRFHERRPRPTAVSAKAIRKTIINGFILGATWGAVPAIFFSSVPDQTRVVITCITAGMLGGGAFALASLPSAALAMLLPLLIGSLWGVLSLGGFTSLLMATLVLVYSGVLIHGVLTHGMNIAQRLASTLAMERIARSDALTGLANRSAFREAIQLAETRFRSSSLPCTLFFVDLDFFKTVNDTHGHAAGDAILVEVAGRLKSCTRGEDLVARLGGDEFAVLVPNIDNAEVIQSCGARLVQAFRAPFVIAGTTISQTISVGAATCSSAFPGGTRSMIHHADIALYRSKHKGRNTYSLYREDEASDVILSDGMERDLRAALTGTELSLVYQPIFNIETLTLTGIKALLRWQHPSRGWIEPAEIMTLADERGLADSLAGWVLTKACGAAAAWPKDIRLTVSLSPAQLQSRTLLTHISSALALADLDPRRLEIEVAEAAIGALDSVAMGTLLALRERDVRLALDDFAANHAILNVLRSVTFDRVKIDGGFVRDMTRQRDSAAMVRSVSGLARELGLNVVAEDVETPECLAMLRALGCSEVQGHLFGEPLTVEAMPDFLRDKRFRRVA